MIPQESKYAIIFSVVVFSRTVRDFAVIFQQFLHLIYRRQGIEEALKQADGSSETVVNTLREYVVMNTTLKSILQKVSIFV